LGIDEHHRPVETEGITKQFMKGKIKMKTTLSWLLVVIACTIDVMGQTTNSKINYEKIYTYGLDADIKSALSVVRQYDESGLNAKDSAFKSQFESRFGFESDLSLYLEERKSPLDEILSIYRDYWRTALLSPEKDFGYMIKNNVSGFLSQKFGLKLLDDNTLDEDTLYIYLRKYVNSFGLTTTGFVKTGKLFDFLVWKSETDTLYNFSVGSDSIHTRVIFLDDFITLGWEEYATFGYYYPGGWISPEALFCVGKGWDIKNENFLISYLCHEGRHFADYKRWPKLNSADMEYRAKLTELAMLNEQLYKRIESFIRSSNRESQNSHSVANYCVIRDLSKVLFNSEFENDIGKWQKINPEKIHNACNIILEENTKRLIEKGPDVEHYLTW